MHMIFKEELLNDPLLTISTSSILKQENCLCLKSINFFQLMLTTEINHQRLKVLTLLIV